MAAHPRNAAGELSLVMGIVAAVFAFFPIIGEFVAAPAAILAVVTGLVAFSRVERGLTPTMGGAWIGIGLGLAAGFVTMLVMVASSDLGA